MATLQSVCLLLIGAVSSCIDQSYRRTIDVFVQDQQGAATKGANVSLDSTCCASLYFDDKPRESCTAITDDVGRASFSIGDTVTCSVTVNAPGFLKQTASFPTPESVTRVDILLAPE
jgi:hypothetical protein